MQMTATSEPESKRTKLPLYISLAVVLAALLSYLFIPAVQSFLGEAWKVLSSGDEARIKLWVSDFGWFGPLVLIFAMVIQMFLIVVPSVALMVVSVLAYGPVRGSLIILVAIFTASSVGYVIGSFFGTILVKKLIGEKSENTISDLIEEYGFWAVFITRINPILSNDAISFVAGVLRMSYRKFILASLLGIAPLTALIAILGESNDGLKNGLFWVSIAGLGFYPLYVIWKKKHKKQNTE